MPALSTTRPLVLVCPATNESLVPYHGLQNCSRSGTASIMVRGARAGLSGNNIPCNVTATMQTYLQPTYLQPLENSTRIIPFSHQFQFYRQLVLNQEDRFHGND